MNVASFFSGIGGFDLGFECAGIATAFQCERDKNCLKLLESKFPNAKRSTDITHESTNADILSACPVWCGGFPCQDLSVAGARAGLAGDRSGLWFRFRELIGRFLPAFVVIENVPGLLSSQEGRDFRTLICGLEELGYGVAWRSLDAQYFGLAQRRERVFIVASLGNLSCAKVLFEPESVCWDNPPRRETGERVAPTISARTKGGGGLGTDFDCDGGLVAFRGNNTSGEIEISTACNAHGGTGRSGDSQDHICGPTGVRRLTPLECERLQGFPDGWTEGFRDSARYRMLGNAVAVPVAEWIANRI